MSTRADLRANLRNRLEDPTPNPLWSDALLHEFLQEAMHRYSARFPAQRTEIVSAAGGETLLPLADPVTERDIAHVRLPNGELLPHAVEGDPAPGWFCWNGVIELKTPALAGAWQIGWFTPRQLPTDDVTPLDLPAGDDEIIVLQAAASALLRRSVEAGKRGLDSSSLALVRIAGAWERAADALVRARFRRATGSRLPSI